jgi:hypothetical protein
MSVNRVSYRPSAITLIFAFVLALLGGTAMAAGATPEPRRASAILLLVSNFLLGLGLGSAVLLALFYVTGASWSVAIRRVPEAFTVLLPLGAVGLIAVLLAFPSLYPWYGSGPQEVEATSPFQLAWLSRSFFLLRSVGYLVLWIVLALAMVRISRRQDATGLASLTVSNRRVAALFLVVFGITCWLSSTDWIMSLEPKWSSTIFGVYNFAGIFLSALAAVTCAAIGLHWAGPFRSILTRSRLHDLGTLLFSFSSFWMYIWFSQYLLIWYVNDPEETAYFTPRLKGEWQTYFLLNVALNWAVPFVVLLFRSAKEKPWLLFTVAGIVLLGRWLDLYMMILPPVVGAASPPGVLEAGALLVIAGLAILFTALALGRASLIPVNDPLLAVSTSEPVKMTQAPAAF